MDLLRWARYYWDRVAAAVLAGLGLLTLLLGYLGVSGTVYPAEQLPYMISGGILGLFFLGSAGILYLSADMRDEWRKLDSIDVTLKELVGATTRDGAAEGLAGPDPSPNGNEPAATDEVADEVTSPAPRKTARATGTKTKTAARAQRRSTGQPTGTRS